MYSQASTPYARMVDKCNTEDFVNRESLNNFCFLKEYQWSCRTQFNEISMHDGLKLSQLGRCIGQQSRNRRLQVAGPR